jgi:hypothetical protein
MQDCRSNDLAATEHLVKVDVPHITRACGNQRSHRDQQDSQAGNLVQVHSDWGVGKQEDMYTMYVHKVKFSVVERSCVPDEAPRYPVTFMSQKSVEQHSSHLRMPGWLRSIHRSYGAVPESSSAGLEMRVLELS